jgi:hypothetical protein
VSSVSHQSFNLDQPRTAGFVDQLAASVLNLVEVVVVPKHGSGDLDLAPVEARGVGHGVGLADVKMVLCCVALE